MNTDVEDITDKLDDIHESLREIGNKLEKVGSDWAASSWWLLIIFIVFFLSPTLTYKRFNKVWYSMTTSAAYPDISVATQPTDCDWAHAPLGNKGCHYKKIVTTIVYGNDVKTQKPIVSYDNGKTWNWWTGALPFPNPTVEITWQKIDEDND